MDKKARREAAVAKLGKLLGRDVSTALLDSDSSSSDEDLPTKETAALRRALLTIAKDASVCPRLTCRVFVPATN